MKNKKCEICEQGIRPKIVNIETPEASSKAKETYLETNLELLLQPPPEPAAPESKMEAQKEVYLWLVNVVKLPQYYDDFIKEGYDSMEIITKILTEEYLKDIIKIKKAGHRQIIMHFVDELKQENKYNDKNDPKNELLNNSQYNSHPVNNNNNYNEGMVGDDVYADIVDTNNYNQYKNEKM